MVSYGMVAAIPAGDVRMYPNIFVKLLQLKLQK